MCMVLYVCMFVLYNNQLHSHFFTFCLPHEEHVAKILKKVSMWKTFGDPAQPIIIIIIIIIYNKHEK